MHIDDTQGPTAPLLRDTFFAVEESASVEEPNEITPPSTIEVAVGSTNPVKINAVRAAFGQHVSGSCISVEGFYVASGVDDQPWTETQTRQGALTRAVSARDAFEAASRARLLSRSGRWRAEWQRRGEAS